MARIYRATWMMHHADGTLIRPSTHWQTDVPTGGDEPDPDDVADGIWDAANYYITQITPTDVTIEALTVTECVIDPDIGVQGVKTDVHAGLLSPGDGDLPRALVPVSNWKTGVSSRSARGWTFWPGPLDSSLVVDGHWDDTYMARVIDCAAAHQASFDLGTLFPTHVYAVVYSRTRHARGLNPHSWRVVGSVNTPKVHYLRSRDTTP